MNCMQYELEPSCLGAANWIHMLLNNKNKSIYISYVSASNINVMTCKSCLTRTNYELTNKNKYKIKNRNWLPKKKKKKS